MKFLGASPAISDFVGVAPLRVQWSSLVFFSEFSGVASSRRGFDTFVGEKIVAYRTFA